MSVKYQSKDVPDGVLADRLDELADIVSGNRERIGAEFTMRIPAECDRDADLVMAEAARRIRGREAAQASAEPVAVMYEDGFLLSKGDCGDTFDICCKVQTPLYAHPPTDSAALRQLLADIKAWDIENLELDIPLPLRQRIEAAITPTGAE